MVTLDSTGKRKKGAFVTFLAGKGDYVHGALGLARSLQLVKSGYKLIVAALPDVPEEHRQLLIHHGCLVREIQPVIPPPGSSGHNFAMAHYVINYSKLRIWEFDDYSKLVYLDADMMVFDSIDELFDVTPAGKLSAVKDCFCEKTWSHTAQYKLGYCQQHPEHDRVHWDYSLGLPPKPYFNAGMCVFEPCKATFQRMIQALYSSPPTPFAEQDFLNKFFQDEFNPIPNVYNLVLAMLWRHPENVQLDKIKVVHYCATGSKPWAYTGKGEHMEREDVKELVKKWWEVYGSSSNIARPLQEDNRGANFCSALFPAVA